jgi:transcriptional regulator with XRE-family HTH domain
MNAVGALLKKFRKNHEPPLTVPEFAGKVGVARSTAFRWESGIRKIDDDKLPRVVEFTGIPAKELRPDLVNLLAAPDDAALASSEGCQ